MHFRNFLKKFLESFEIFLEIPQQFVFFVQTCEKINAWLVKYFERFAKIMRFFYFLKNFFWKFSKILRLGPLDHNNADPKKVFPRTKILVPSMDKGADRS